MRKIVKALVLFVFYIVAVILMLKVGKWGWTGNQKGSSILK